MKIRRTVSARLTHVAAAAALAAAAGLAGPLATGPAASASPVPGHAAATTSAWRTQATPEPAGTIDQSFDDVSCSSSSACLAIASYVVPHKKDIILGAFAETWNGSRWAVRSVPNGTGKVDLEGVKCRSARWCVAVGGFEAAPPSGNQVPVADSWNGRTWKQVKLPVPAGAVNGSVGSVACSGTAACTAIGSFANKSQVQGTMVERWNGSAWKVQAIPAPSGGGGNLEGVACPTVHVCRAVGYDDAGVLTEFWNGSAWKVQPAPQPAGALQTLSAISCTAVNSCEAVGTYESETNLDWYSLAEVWNGSRWRVQATPVVSGATSAALTAVSCVSATDCEAGGQVMTKGGSVASGVLEKWNGTRWSIQEKLPAKQSGPSRVEGVSCTTGPVCEAVGFRSQPVDGGTLLAQRYSSR
jgi:hypothetical protein